MPYEYSLTGLLDRMYQSQLGLEAALMELTLVAERQGSAETGQNVRGSLEVIGENSGYIKQGLARLKNKIGMNIVLFGALEMFYY